MELSESVMKGLQTLADPNVFDLKSLTIFTEVAFDSLVSSRSESVLGHPELRHIDQTTLKQCHTAATTFILECVKQNADKPTISSCLEDVRFQNERVDTFYNSFQVMFFYLFMLLSTDTCPPHITDAEWRLEYCIKNSHVHKVNQPSYLISLNTERAGASSEINFSCTMDQLQDLVGKMKDAAKSLERATQS
uniref:COMM domain-containing protein 3 n=1 Tax=Sinocyclocheilus anshuiensis TaxID=1608454 RepID=A0A671N7U6_9TELE